MTDRQLSKFIATLAIIAVFLAGLFIWRSQLSELDRCLTDECRYRVQMKQHEVEIERALRDSERADREAAKTNAKLCRDWNICVK